MNDLYVKMNVQEKYIKVKRKRSHSLYTVKRKQ